VKTSLLKGRARLNLTAVHDGLHEPSGADADRYSVCSTSETPRRPRFAASKPRAPPGSDAARAEGHVTWLDAAYDRYIAVATGERDGRCRGQPVEQCTRVGRPGWAEWKGRAHASVLLALTVDATAQSTVFYTPFNDAIQRQAAYATRWARERSTAPRSTLVRQRVRQEPDGHRLHHGGLRDIAGRVRRPARRVAAVWRSSSCFRRWSPSATSIGPVHRGRAGPFRQQSVTESARPASLVSL
jgi:hypothetical protein